MVIDLNINTPTCGTDGGAITGDFEGDASASGHYIVTCSNAAYGTFTTHFPGTFFGSFSFGPLQNGAWLITVRRIGGDTVEESVDVACATAPSDTVLIQTPARDWLPVFQPITYKFLSPDVAPEPLCVKIEISANGVDFITLADRAPVLVQPAETGGTYTVNVAAVLESAFTVLTIPNIGGTEPHLFKYYRLQVGKLSLYDGTTGTPELTTSPAHCLFATVAKEPDYTTGFITLSETLNINSELFDSVYSRANLTTGVVETRAITYDTENPNPQRCFKNPVQLYWLGAAGGWQTFIWEGKHENTIEVPEPETWEDANYNVHTSRFPGGITEKVQLYSGFLTKSEYPVVLGIVSAIRAYHLDNGVFREINIVPDTHLKQQRISNRYELNLSFTYAQKTQVQHL